MKAYINRVEDEQGTSIGFVKFSTTAEILSNLTNNTEKKENFTYLVQNLYAENSTSIGAGKRTAFSNL